MNYYVYIDMAMSPERIIGIAISGCKMRLDTLSLSNVYCGEIEVNNTQCGGLRCGSELREGQL